MIDLFRPLVGAAELAAVAEVFASGWLGNGPRTDAFEARFAEHLGCDRREVLAVASCTEGLFQAIGSLGLGAGDEVVLPSISFIGAAHAVRSTGATVVPCDVDHRSLNPRVEDVERAMSDATRAVVVLHFGGHPGDVVGLAELARRRGVALVEDAACGLGSSTTAGPCGMIGEIGAWSFDAMKVVTGGDGGMVRCRDPERADRLRSQIRHGIPSSGFARRGQSGRWWEIDPPEPGRRATMNDVAAAIATVQLERLPSFLARRAAIAAAYDEALSDLPWLDGPPAFPPDAARTFYWVQTDPSTRDRLATHLLGVGVYTNFRYWPLHRMSLYPATSELAGADRAAATTLLLPLHQGLSDVDVEVVVEAVQALPRAADQ